MATVSARYIWSSRARPPSMARRCPTPFRSKALPADDMRRLFVDTIGIGRRTSPRPFRASTATPTCRGLRAGSLGKPRDRQALRGR
jgi:hypothetical protein